MQVDVGQLLFVLDTKSHSIVPAQVDEVLVSKTVKGETVQYKLIFPNGKKAVLEKMTAPWFTDISGAKSFLLSEAEKMVDAVVKKAQESAEKNFSFEQPSNHTSEIYEPPVAVPELGAIDDEVTVDLGDGRTAKVSLPKEFSLESTTS